MPLNVSKIKNGGGKKYTQPTLDPGTYPARLVQIIDLGLQAQPAYEGKDKPPAYEMMLTYELYDTFMVDEQGNELEDKPRWISETIPLRSLDSDLAKSTKRYFALDPNKDYDGDFTLLINTPCNVTIAINKKGDKVYENISNVSTMRQKEAERAPELKNAPKVFNLDSPDMEVFNSLPDWLKEKIQENLEYDGSTLQKALGGARKATKAQGKATPQTPPQEEPTDDSTGDDDLPW